MAVAKDCPARGPAEREVLFPFSFPWTPSSLPESILNLPRRASTFALSTTCRMLPSIDTVACYSTTLRVSWTTMYSGCCTSCDIIPCRSGTLGPDLRNFMIKLQASRVKFEVNSTRPSATNTIKLVHRKIYSVRWYKGIPRKYS